MKPEMAGASLLLLIDDIASVLDDVAALTKVAAQKRRACWVTIWH
jgi:predicted DNA repair protein MutK